MSNLGYDWRPDGNFLITYKCAKCGEPFDVHAMSQWEPTKLCAACKQVEKWMEAGHEGQ